MKATKNKVSSQPTIFPEDEKTRKILFTTAGTGAAIGGLVIAMGVFTMVASNFHFPDLTAPFAAFAKTDPGKNYINVDDYIKKGDLTKAQDLLEQCESAVGLTPEDSEKLDKIYIALASIQRKKGNKKAALDFLHRIPPESSWYATAQDDIKAINSPPVKRHKRPHHKAQSHSKHHT